MVNPINGERFRFDKEHCCIYDVHTTKSYEVLYANRHGNEAITKIDGYIADDERKMEEDRAVGKESAPLLVNSLAIQKKKRELIRELTGL